MATELTTDLDLLATILGSGGVAVIPTDTVYGVAASLRFPDAVRRLFAVKLRPETVALPVMCGDVESARQVASHWPIAAQRLAERFWPGPLTIIVPADPTRAEIVGGEGRIGLRVPHDEHVRELLRRTGPLAVSSANEHGSPPATTARAALETVGPRVECVFDGGLRHAAVSTVIDVVDDIIFRRDGALSREALLSCLAE